MNRLLQRLGLRTHPVVFSVSAGLVLTFVAITMAFTDQVGTTFAAASEQLLTSTGWFYILGVTTFLIFLIWLAFSRYGHLRLGRDDERPEFGNLAWFGMLFAAGIGTILMFWGVAEPLSHFVEPPLGDVEPRSLDAATEAMNFTLYHFGLHTWAIFGLPALGFAYFAHRRGLPMRVSSVLHPLLGDRIRGPWGWSVDILAVLGTLFGVAVSLGLGTLQINSGLSHLTGIPESTGVQVGLIATVTLIATISVALGLDKGIRRLSNLNIGLAVGLLGFVLVFGPTLLMLRGTVQSLGNYLTSLPFLAFWTDALGDTGWQQDWTVFYWAWTITWAPFVGIFVARISRGRTIREFILGVLALPTAFTVLWFSSFGLAAIDLDLAQGGTISETVVDNVPVSLFVFLESLPISGVTSALAVLIVVIFFTTSSDSASLVVDTLSADESVAEPPVRQRVFWAIVEGAVAATLLVIGGLEALQNVITVLGFPFFALGLFIIWSLLRGLGQESLEPRPTRRRHPGRDAPPPRHAHDASGASPGPDTTNDLSAAEDDRATPEPNPG